MARRRKSNSPFDDLIEVLLLFPWWVTLILGSGLWVYLKWQPSPSGFSLEKSVANCKLNRTFSYEALR